MWPLSGPGVLGVNYFKLSSLTHILFWKVLFERIVSCLCGEWEMFSVSGIELKRSFSNFTLEAKSKH